MRYLSGLVFTSVALLLLAIPYAATAQPAKSVPTTTVRDPVFSSSGITVTMLSIGIAADKRGPVVSLTIENRNKFPIGLILTGKHSIIDNKGNSYTDVHFDGIATCGLGYDMSIAAQECNKEAIIKTEIDAGSSALVNARFFCDRSDCQPGTIFSYTGIIMFNQIADSDNPLEKADTHRVKFINIAIPLIPLS